MINNQTAWTTGWRTFLVSVSKEGVSEPEWITTHTNARTNHPTFSPNGMQLAYL